MGLCLMLNWKPEVILNLIKLLHKVIKSSYPLTQRADDLMKGCLMIKFLNRRYYAGCYVYLYGVKDRYWKICVDKRMPKNIQVYKQDLRGKFFSSYNFKGDFKTFKQAKQYLKYEYT